jgi:DNA phosphorothioation system restriction enzyme
MSLNQLELSYQYRSDDKKNILEHFYMPVLSEAKIYKRSIGYFSINSLVAAAKGVSVLIENGGKMFLIATPFLNIQEQDLADEEGLIEKSLLKSLEHSLNSAIVQERLNYLAWLIDNGQLNIKIAVSKNKGLEKHYEKGGVIEDYNGNKLAFINFFNELGEQYCNFEIIDVFCSWKEHEEYRVIAKEKAFDQLWANIDKNMNVYELPEKVKHKILEFRKGVYYQIDPEVKLKSTSFSIQEGTGHYPAIPDELTIRDYQQEAVRSWFRNDCRGLLEMATGTGKTITALVAITKLWEITKRLGVIIVCPYTHLVEQWAREVKKFNMLPIIAHSSRTLWEEELNNYIFSFQSKAINHFCLITTIATFQTDAMQKILRKLDSDVVFVADEAHHLGAKQIREKLIDTIEFRLALSATPVRWYDEEGTKKITDYFGNVIFKFGLDQAIKKGYLTKYYYYPHLVYLEEDESEKYYEITRKLAKLLSKTSGSELWNMEQHESLQGLLIERSRILSSARNKLTKLRELFKHQTQSRYNLIYCGDSSVDGEKQIDRVVKILGEELDMKVHTFTSREALHQRKKLLELFESGELQCLVAIKCLDEGIDIPAVQHVYLLSSSTNPREFIQRRGRILRKHPNKKYSYIHDFIVIPRDLEEINTLEPSIFNIERALVKKEFMRLSEFAELSVNGPQVQEKLTNVKKIYNLLDI